MTLIMNPFYDHFECRVHVFRVATSQMNNVTAQVHLKYMLPRTECNEERSLKISVPLQMKRSW